MFGYLFQQSESQDHPLMDKGPEKYRYQKRRGFSSTSGQDYEVALCCLLFLRALRITSDFFMACNHDHAGTFDDVVLFYRLKENQGHKYSAIFLQAKHKNKFSEKKLTQSNPFRLLRYLESFKKIRTLWEQPVNVESQLIQLQDILVVLYTNTGCEIGDTALDVTNFPEMQSLQNILGTNGRLLRISEGQRAGLPEGPDTTDFLAHLLLCTEQMSIETVDYFIEDEFRKVLRLSSPDAAQNLNSELKRIIKGWWSEEGEGRYLTAQCEEWMKVLNMHIMNLKNKHMHFASHLHLDYTADAFEELKSVLSRVRKGWIYVKDEYQATATRVRLFKTLTKCLVLCAKVTWNQLEEVEVLWGTAVFPTLVLDISGDSPENSLLLQRLQEAVHRHACRVLIVIAKDEPTSRDWSFVGAGETWPVLDYSTRERLLSVHVDLQGSDVVLRDVIGSHVDDIMSDKVINFILEPVKNAIKLGEAIPSPQEYYLPRCLQRTSTNMFNFDTLKNRNTLIFTKNLLFIPKMAFVNGFKVLWPSDLKKINEIKETIFVKGLSLDSEIRKLCSKFQVCGINGEIGQEKIEGNVTEFVPLTWMYHEKIVIIDGVPGVGKSSFVTAMCSSVKRRFPEAWVLRLDMGRHSDYIKETNFKNDRNVIEFLLKVLPNSPLGLERGFLEHSLFVTGNVFLFLDAFDEISPDYTTKCCDLLKAIVQSVKFRKMVVTTRPVTKKDVEDALGTKAFTLPVFSEEEQNLLIKRFTETDGNAVEDEKIFSLIQSAGTVLEIPLLCKMAAEVLLYYHDDIFTQGEDPWRKIRLYKLFVGKSIEQRLVDKFGLELTIPGVKKILESSQKRHLQNLQEFAVKKLLSVNELSMFQFSTETPEEKFGLVVNTGQCLDFVHKTFAEYFIGCWLAEHWKECPQYLIHHIFFQDVYEFVLATFNWSLFEGFPLHEAVALGDTVAVQQFMSTGTADKGGRSPLHIAAMSQREHRQFWEMLMAAGEDPNRKDDILHSTAIRYAEIFRNWEMVDYLLQEGANPDDLKLVSYENFAKDTLLRIIHYDIGNLSRYILRIHSRLMHLPLDDEENSALHLASAHDSLEITKVLLELRHPVNVKNIYGNTPLHGTSALGLEEAVKLLLKNGADPNVKNTGGNTALILAAWKGHMAVARLLLEHGADPGMKNNSGHSALFMASFYGQTETMKLLIQNKADPVVMRDTANQALILSTGFGNLEMVRFVLENGADVDTRDEYGRTALILAAWRGHVRTARLLLEKGADPNVKNKEGHSALILASMNGHLDTVRLLTVNGADPSEKDDCGDTALFVAAKKGYEEIVQHFLNIGADPSLTDAQGKTVFEICSVEMFESLRQDGNSGGGCGT